jgi:hypothetical protein
MTMDQPELRQAEIEAKRAALIQEVPAMWRRMISEWGKPSGEDRVWLTFSANYLFRTQNIRWAIDLTPCMPGCLRPSGGYCARFFRPIHPPVNPSAR